MSDLEEKKICDVCGKSVLIYGVFSEPNGKEILTVCVECDKEAVKTEEIKEWISKQ